MSGGLLFICMLKHEISIVIPSKNESINIYDCVASIAKQKYIDGTNVIIADISDEQDSIDWLRRTKEDFSYKLNIKIIKGGFPAKGRLEGSKFVTTPYILFLDSDVMFINDRTIMNSYEMIIGYEKDLVTIPFKTERGWNWAFRLFDFSQWVSYLMGTPFAIGGFQLFKTKVYWEVGGYIEDELFAEDYSISSKISPKKFMIYRFYGVWTSARRFKNKGIWWMVRIMFKSYINRKNPEFFKHHHNYWN
jgi:glycosyltransferase involved in cell wall biosynthesis